MSRKTLNTSNLIALGPEKLADLLMEVSAGSADIKRRLRMELSHNLGTQELAHDLQKRLLAIRKSKARVGWRGRKALVRDLATQASLICEKITPSDPATAFGLLWQFIELAPAIHARTDDSRGEVAEVFRTALTALHQMAPLAQIDPATLADQVWAAVTTNTHGQWDHLIPLLAPTLGHPGMAYLQTLAQTYADMPLDTPQNTYAATRKARFIKWVLQEIAAAAGDTAAYIAQFAPDELTQKDVAAEVATLLLHEGQPTAALKLLQNATQGADPTDWDTAYIATLTALGHIADAQAHRLACFHDTLNAGHLRDYLKLLPDFEDVEAEDRARAHVLHHPGPHAALRFCLDWPDLLTAATLVETREFDGSDHALLTAAADALRPRHPLAAVTLSRAMIDDTLNTARTARYAHAADQLAECAALDGAITDYAPLPDHNTYLEALRRRHPRKTAFWSNLPPLV
jgi:hypothetical protein